jgi:hypothetical protein
MANLLRAVVVTASAVCDYNRSHGAVYLVHYEELPATTGVTHYLLGQREMAF